MINSVDWYSIFSGIGGVILGAVITWLITKRLERTKMKQSIQFRIHENILGIIDILSDELENLYFLASRKVLADASNGKTDTLNEFNELYNIIIFNQSNKLTQINENYKIVLKEYQIQIKSIQEQIDILYNQCLRFDAKVKQFIDNDVDWEGINNESKNVCTCIVRLQDMIKRYCTEMYSQFCDGIFK